MIENEMIIGVLVSGFTRLTGNGSSPWACARRLARSYSTIESANTTTTARQQMCTKIMKRTKINEYLFLTDY